MKSRILLLLVGTAWACGGGDDNVIPDSGNDVTNGGDSGGKDSTTTDAPGNDGTTNDATGNDGPTTDGTTESGGGDAGTTFACGKVTCDSKTQFCQKAQKGLDAGLPDASKLDSGTIEVDTCLPYPTACTADGGTPSCSCVSGTGCTCAQSGSDITQTCQ